MSEDVKCQVCGGLYDHRDGYTLDCPRGVAPGGRIHLCSDRCVQICVMPSYQVPSLERFLNLWQQAHEQSLTTGNWAITVVSRLDKTQGTLDLLEQELKHD